MLKSGSVISLLIAISGIVGAPNLAAAHHESSKVDRRTREHAEKLRNDGAEALLAKDLPAAKKALYQSYERNPVSETLYFLGLLAAAEGRAVESQDLLRRFLREVGDVVDADQLKEAKRILSQPIPPFGELDAQGERGALLSVDDRLLGILPLSQPLILPPGAHTVQLGQGSRKVAGPVEIRVGRTEQLRFDMATGVAVVTLPPTVLLLEDLRLAPPPAQTALDAAVEKAIRAEQLAILSARVALLRAPELGNCLSTRPCQEQLMQRNEVDFTLHVYLAAAPTGGGVIMQGQLIDAITGESIAGLTDALDMNRAEQFSARATALTTRLIDAARNRPRGTLEVLSTPPGAEVVLPHGVVGVTPYQRPAFAGLHEVTVQLAGYQPTRVAVRVEAGKKETVQLLLNPLSGADAGTKSGARLPKWRLASGIVGVSLGGTLLLIGTLGLLDDRTDPKSITATVLGSAITAGGVLLLTLPLSGKSVAAKK